MDWYLFDKFFVETDDEFGDFISRVAASEAQKIHEIDNRVFCNYLVEDTDYAFKLIVEGTKDNENKKITLEKFFVHHTSKDFWEVEISGSADAKKCLFD